ncbi:mitochondrial ribosomal protein MRP51 [Apiosordaria backusii]|uniref:Mitochondrial ribosomal protein MRP51 n=1 Tax=Apiosordaria backusii TaxID=314023 RepID=A0AA40AAB2_9PEZI|nr:mitochondrial ribosomal protein MRP51 [Apiosordaria backusii]
MASRSVSPGGALLRASRMFSMPAPLPPPAQDAAQATFRSHSDTATTAYPTHQVITTFSHARKEGDWGLKRPLPLRSTTKSSTPMLRIKAIDTIEQITDYASGADHGLSLLKFQELGLPIVTPPPRGAEHRAEAAVGIRSVFEDDIDCTDVAPKDRPKLVDRRWRFSGPWLAGMSPGDFKKYLAEKVRPRRHEFRAFLMTKIVRDLNEARRERALNRGETWDESDEITAETVPGEIVSEFLRGVRQQNATLFKLVGEFLDLAPLKRPSELDITSLANSFRYQADVAHDTRNPYAENGPPSTHPSAGLSYIRTNGYMDNHPVYGPQKERKPVEARVLKPRTNQNYYAKLGIAGFVSETLSGDNIHNQKSAKSPLRQFDPDLKGGAKIYVHPSLASVDSAGKLLILVRDFVDPEAELVARELIGDGEGLFGQQQRQPVEEELSQETLRRKYSQKVSQGAEDYGISFGKVDN